MPPVPQTCALCGRAVTDAWLCASCCLDAKDDWRFVMDLAPDLGRKMTRQRTSWPGGVTAHTAETPLPYDERAARCFARVKSLARQLGDITGQPRGLSNWEWLRTRPQRLGEHPDGPAWAQEVTRLRTDAALALDPPPDRLYLGPCDLTGNHCDGEIYVVVDERGVPTAAQVPCPACANPIEVAPRREELLAAAMDHIASLREIHRLLKVYGGLGASPSYDTLRGLVRHKRITSPGRLLFTEPQKPARWVAGYRVGDVLSALSETKRVKRAKKNAD